MWTVILVAANAIAAEPTGWDILTLHGRTLQRTHGSNTETVTTVDFLPAPSPDQPVDVDGVLVGAESLHLWGDFGLGWVNLATHRASRLTEAGRAIHDVHATESWLFYASGDEIRAWSNTEGHEVTLCQKGCEDFASAPAGSVAWVDSAGVHLADKEALDATEPGAVVTAKSLAARQTDRVTKIVFAPDGSKIGVFSGDAASSDGESDDEGPGGDGGGGEADEGEAGPFTAAWFDATGKSIRTETYPNPDQLTLFAATWREGGAPTLELDDPMTVYTMRDHLSLASVATGSVA